MYPVWRLAKNLEKKFRLGHPWVFANDLGHSPKGLEAGSLIELRDHSGEFLALGYGNPHSLIAFRILSRDPRWLRTGINVDFFRQKISAARDFRCAAGLALNSYRLSFAEADGLPGLIIDRFIDSHSREVLAVQAGTAGMERLKTCLWPALEELFPQSSWLEVNDGSGRRLEGLPIEGKKIIKENDSLDFTNFDLSIQSLNPEKPLLMRADLLGGQKTGFFLDQRSNTLQAAQWLAKQARAQKAREQKQPLRILDLFCYVGQWGVQLANAVATDCENIEVTLLDSSASALQLAKFNVERTGASAIAQKMDVVSGISALPMHHYDVVVCDPPAFVKKRKDLPAGQVAYAKLNREALRRLKPGGLFVSCSCSGLLTDEDFRTALTRAISSAGVGMRFLFRGSHSPDHPQLPQFPQGSYLKSWIGRKESEESV